MRKPAKRKHAQPLRSLTDMMLKINAAINQEPAGAPQVPEPERRRARVFISFSRHDADTVAKLAAELEGQSFQVWWSGLLTGGMMFPEEIAEKLDAADVVLVLWTPASIVSGWVQSEAKRALDQRKLVPVRLPTLDVSAIPLPFGTLHTLVLGDADALAHGIDRVHDAGSRTAGTAKFSPTK